MVVAETGGVLLSVPAISLVRAIISGARVIRSSWVFRSWRGFAVVMVVFLLVPVALGFGVLVMVWVLEFVGVALVAVGSRRVEGMALWSREVEGCACTLWLRTNVCRLDVTFVTAVLKSKGSGVIGTRNQI